MRSLVLIRDQRRRLPLPESELPEAAAANSTSTAALAIDPVHGTGFVLLGAEGKLVACDPEEGGVVVWTADLDAAAAEVEEEDGDGATAVRVDCGVAALLVCPPAGLSKPVHTCTHAPPPQHNTNQNNTTQPSPKGGGHGPPWLACFHLAEAEAALCVARSGALVLVDCATGEASLAGVVGPGGVLAASLAPDEELLVFVTGAAVLLGMTPGLEVLYEVRLFGWSLRRRRAPYFAT